MSSSLRVLLPLPLPAFNFQPPHGQALPERGCRVVVPWQNGTRIGLVSGYEELKGAAGLELREAIACLDARPYVTEQALAVIERSAAHACVPAGLVLANLLPVGLTTELEHEVRALKGVEGLPVPHAHFTPASDYAPQQLDLWRRQGLVLERILPAQPTVQVLRAVKPADEALQGARRANQRRALEVLWGQEDMESAAALAREAEVPESAVRSLIAKGYAAYVTAAAPPPPLPHPSGEPLDETAVALPEGLPVLSVAGGRRKDRLAALLPLLRHDLEKGGGVLVLVPEQALLTEVAGQLANHMPVSVLSGELSDRQRERLWEELLAGETRVLVSSYLGLLAPLTNLRRVVVLEEASGSYKLASGSRLYIPKVARFLAEAHGVPLVLSDVLPGPETYHELPQEARLHLDSPDVRLHISDLSATSNWPLSGDLIRVLGQIKERSRQAIMLAPRRGFSAALSCGDCRWIAMCPNCDLPLRYHRERYRIKCHQCGHVQDAPKTCPACDGTRLQPAKAAGTQWVAREVADLLPDFPVKRYDTDQRDDLTDFMAGEPGVLVATSAIMRHPPLPKVSLVAVTLLDTSLSFSDFRAEEETYRLLLNLAELAPQSRPLTLVQTFQPEHPVLQSFQMRDQAGFMQTLLERRRRFGYPPFSAMAKLQVSARQQSTAEHAASRLAKALAIAGAGPDELLGPAPAPVARVRNQYSFQLFLRSADHDRLRGLLQPALAYQGPARVRVEVDPRDVDAFID